MNLSWSWSDCNVATSNWVTNGGGQHRCRALCKDKFKAGICPVPRFPPQRLKPEASAWNCLKAVSCVTLWACKQLQHPISHQVSEEEQSLSLSVHLRKNTKKARRCQTRNVCGKRLWYKQTITNPVCEFTSFGTLGEEWRACSLMQTVQYFRTRWVEWVTSTMNWRKHVFNPCSTSAKSREARTPWQHVFHTAPPLRLECILYISVE